MQKGFFLRYIVPVLGLAGIIYGVGYVGAVSPLSTKDGPTLEGPPSSPYAESISGAGLIEANSRNIKIGSTLSGIIRSVDVVEGQEVKMSDPLFKLDDRSARAELLARKSEIAVMEAKIQEAQASLNDQKDQLDRAEQLKLGVSISVDRIERLRRAVETATARLRVAQSDKQAALRQLEKAQVSLDQHVVLSPIEGRVLKVNVRPGEFVRSDSVDTPPVMIGNDKPLYVRVSIDENDLWRLKGSKKAEGALRSNRNVRFPMKFLRIEPYVVPKTSLSGLAAERVDTRVLEVLYEIEETDLPLYIGQQVDVYIDVSRSSNDPAS